MPCWCTAPASSPRPRPRRLRVYHEAAAEGDATWIDGRLLLEPEEEAKMLARAQRKAEVTLKQSKEAAVKKKG